jgi:predicted phage terminase large subunit-like protein
MNSKDVKKIDKLKGIIKKYNRAYHIIDKGTYIDLIFRDAAVSRWLRSWRFGNSIKVLPEWVENIDKEFQKELIKGYIDAGGWFNNKAEEIKITSICYEGLLCAQRILARLDIPSSIRSGAGPRWETFTSNGREHISLSKKKYDLRFKKNISVLGYPVKNQTRYSLTRQHIEDNFLWRKVREVKQLDNYDIFVPIKTENSTYRTSFGLSHNCDDIDSQDSVRSQSERDFIRYEWFDKGLMFVGGDELTDFLVVGTILGKDSLLNALLDPSEYPDWTSYKFKAVEKFSTSPLWDEWRSILINRLDSERKENAKKFFLEHKEEMLEGTQVLWPEGDPYYDLMVYKTSNPSGFNSGKQNEPVDPNKILISKEQLHFENFANPKFKEILSRCHFYGALDPSLGKKTSVGDYSCICTIARDPKTGYLFVVNFDLKRRSVDSQIDAIIKNHERHNYKMFGVETNAFQYVVAENLRKKSKEVGAYVPIKDIQSILDKKLRFEGIVPLMSDGTVVFDSDKYRESGQYSLAVDLITSCTGASGESDDSFDALSMCIQIAKKSRFRIITHQNR